MQAKLNHVKCMLKTRKETHSPIINFSKWKHSVWKLLGVAFDNELTFGAHIEVHFYLKATKKWCRSAGLVNSKKLPKTWMILDTFFKVTFGFSTPVWMF